MPRVHLGERPARRADPTQRLLLAALVPAMTGFDATFDGPPVEHEELAAGLARRTVAFRSRIVQNMVLLGLALRPLPASVAERIASFAAELSVDEDMLVVASEFAADSLGLAAVDFDRNGYTAHWTGEDAAALHTTGVLASAWDLAVDDPDLARRWAELEALHPGTLGRQVAELSRSNTGQLNDATVPPPAAPNGYRWSGVEFGPSPTQSRSWSSAR